MQWVWFAAAYRDTGHVVAVVGISIIAVGDSPAAIGTLLSFKKTVGIHMDPVPSMITRSPARSRALAAVLNFPGRDSNVCRVIR